MARSKLFLITCMVAGVIGMPALSKSSQDRLIKPINKKTSKDKYVELPPWGYIPREVDKRSKQGENLYKKHNCRECHSIMGKGGEVGPPLDGIGGHRGAEWLHDRLMDPEKQMKQFAHVFGNKENIMPHPALNEDEAGLIVDYLRTLPEPEGGFMVAVHGKYKRDKKYGTYIPAKQDLESAMRGAKLFYDSHCYTCHSTDGSRDRFGPDLAGIGNRIGEKKLYKFLKRPVNSGFMKTQLEGLSKKDLQDLKAFLLTIPLVEKNKQEK